MARKKKKPRVSFSITEYIREDTLQSILAILFFAIAIFLFLAAWDKAGIVGNYTYEWLSSLLGVGYYLLPLTFIATGISFLRSVRSRVGWSEGVSGLLFFISGLGIIDVIFANEGGVVGGFISKPLVRLFDVSFSLILLVTILVISLLVMFDVPVKATVFSKVSHLFKRKEKEESDDDDAIDETIINLDEKNTEDPEEKEEDVQPEKERTGIFSRRKKKDDDELIISSSGFGLQKTYTPPPLSILQRDSGRPDVGDVKANLNIIKRTLQNFGIAVEMDEVSIGPSVTRYALKPAEGVRLSKILGLQNNLELALAAHPVRIEAPIPGKSLVGIEVPNSSKATVGLATLLGSPEFSNSEKPLMVALGKGISGAAHVANLGKMPHLLIAGATGSGKSVTLHAIVTSLLYRNSPENLKFIMVDPKRVELTLYNKIPHLLTPVITDAKKTILALKWAAKEMERRYDILEQNSVRDIDSYHKTVLAPALTKFKKEGPDADQTNLPDTMPYIVVVIDELAEIMLAYPRELEAGIVRLAQLSRAVGIHLIISTQRPSVNVITGLIKANIPARLALQVSSQIDSRTILDMAGAEKLLGAGDMLFMSGEMSKPSRLQSAFISEQEVKKVADYLSHEYENEVPQEIDITQDSKGENVLFSDSLDAEEDNEDPLFEDARQTVISAGKASTSYLQRKLGIGYSRAARLIDMLEERGIIGAQNGSKPRDIILDTTDSVDSDSSHDDDTGLLG